MKKTFYVLLSLVVVLAGWIFIGSIDDSDYDDLGLLAKIIDVPEEQNGYRSLFYIQDDDFKLFSDNETREKLDAHLSNEQWDDDFVQRTLAENRQHIKNVISSTKYNFFKFQEMDEFGLFPGYISIKSLNQLVILQSMSEAKTEHFNNAILLAGSAISFSQQIKTESNNMLISHMIGLALQYEALLWIHHLAVDYELNESQYAKILNILNSIPSYNKDSFAEIFSGEYVFVGKFLDSILEAPLSQRWNEYNTIIENDFYLYTGGFKDHVFNSLRLLFPYYYVHKNSLLNERAIVYTKLAELSVNYCDKIIFEDKKQHYELSWSDVFRPNSLFEPFITASVFKEYYYRRCFGHAHIESVKTIVALKKYELKTGDLPNHIMELVPDYLKLMPVDPFNGKSLKYSKAKRWVYSVGDDFEDNEGSIEAYYVKRCENNQSCSKNPTFSIIPKQ